MPTYDELEKDDNNHSVFFVEKTQILKTINSIYDSLLELSYEQDEAKERQKKMREEIKIIKDNIIHLKHILQKDLIIRETTREKSKKSINLNAIKMSVMEWNEYINRSNSNSSASDNNSNNKFSSITTSNK